MTHSSVSCGGSGRNADDSTPTRITENATPAAVNAYSESGPVLVVSDDAFNSTDNKGTNQILAADGGTVKLRFKHPGTFVYYCRFHAHLDAFNQPVAPGPDGGIQDANGNFGTPMTGVVTVLPKKD